MARADQEGEKKTLLQDQRQDQEVEQEARTRVLEFQKNETLETLLCYHNRVNFEWQKMHIAPVCIEYIKQYTENNVLKSRLITGIHIQLCTNSNLFY